VFSRAFLGAFAALSLASACPHAAHAAPVQTSQSGWQWGNPTPQGNTIRAIDFVQGRGYAIGDDGTALRTDDGGGTWTGLPTGTSLDLTRVQAVTPDVVTVLGGDGCVLRRSDDGGKTFRRFYVLTEVGCPEPVAATFFVTPQLGYILLRNGNVLRTSDAGQSFSRVTAIPGTPGSAGGGNATPADAIFTTPDTGIVFLAGAAFRTTDAGASWTPEPDVPPANVRRLKAVDATTFYAFGPNTLLRSADAGQTWQAKPAGGATITGVSCATPDLCLLTTDRGDRLLRTENGGDSSEPITASTAPLYAAGFPTATRAVAAGAGGATAVSDDAGRNYTPVGGDIAGSFQFGLRLGPAPNIALALGARGQLARTIDNGVTWKAINVATSSDMRDTSFSSADDGYALDVRGGLFRTTNGGASWQPIDPGTTSAPRGVITSGDTVLLAGPRGIRRATAGGPFSVADSRARVDRFDRAGRALFAYGAGTVVRSTNRGRTWRTVKRPGRVADLEMTSADAGFALTTDGRVWRTTNGGRRWTDLPAVGTGQGLALAFGSAGDGFLTLRNYPADSGVAYVQRTTDGGKHWRPQRITAGAFPGTEGVISPSGGRAYALTSTPAAGNGVFRSLFTTATGGDFGSPSSITLSRARRSGRTVTVTGQLRGAQGGEAIVVSSRVGTRWSEQVVTAGANGGRFTASFRVRGRATFVARWAGDSGRQGTGSSALKGPR
jgi:photosystem II stability/assembly factor-like uncharacterized protein